MTATSTIAARQYVYNLYVNGVEVGVGPSRQNDDTLYYNTYDITSYLSDGDNVVGAICYSEESPAFLCQITYYMSDGTQKIVANSGRDQDAWSALKGDDVYLGDNNQSIGTQYYTAVQENINALTYPAGWCTSDYSDSDWESPSESNAMAEYTLETAQIDNMKRYKVVPQSVTKKSDGSYLVDLGKEIVGSIALHVDSDVSTRITLEYGEELGEDGNAKYQMNTGNVYQEFWTLKAGEQQISGIGMKAFRYVTIRNLPFEIDTENVTGLSIRQEFDEGASSFSSSNQVLNDLYEMAKYTCKVTLQDVYVDTQSRERCPYEGDALITAMNNYSFSAASSSAAYSAEYLLDNTTWPAEYSLYNIILVYENYMHTGDIRKLETCYQNLKEKTLEQYYDASMGLMTEITSPTVEGQKIMVDWPASERDGYQVEDAYYNTVFNAVCVGGYESMALIAQVLDYMEESAYYQGLADSIRGNMIEKLYNSDTGEFCDGLTQEGQVIEHSSQHANAYALAFGIYSDQEMSDRIASSIEEDGELKMSVYGAYFLLQGLYESNHGELARKMMSNPDSALGIRSWAYMIYELGATIATEAWNSVLKPNMSLCHPWGAAPGVMLVRGMFGIQPTSAGYDTFQIKLQPGGVAEAEMTTPTMKGEIITSYAMDGKGGISCIVTVPANSAASLYIPNLNDADELIVDGKTIEAEQEEGYLVCQLDPGSHVVYAETGIYENDSELK